MTTCFSSTIRHLRVTGVDYDENQRGQAATKRSRGTYKVLLEVGKTLLPRYYMHIHKHMLFGVVVFSSCKYGGI